MLGSYYLKMVLIEILYFPNFSNLPFGIFKDRYEDHEDKPVDKNHTMLDLF